MAVPVSRIAIDQPCALTLAHEDALLLVASGRRHGVYAVQLDGQVRLKANTRRVACFFFYLSRAAPEASVPRGSVLPEACPQRIDTRKDMCIGVRMDMCIDMYLK